MIRAVLATILALLAAPAAAVEGSACRSDAAVEADVALLKRMEQERIAAGVRKDTAAVAAATEPDYVQIDFDGRILDRAATNARIGGSAIQLRSNAIDDVVVRICGDTAIVTGRAHPRGVLDGQSFEPEISYSRVYLRRDGRWRVILFQQTRQVAPR